MLGGSTDLEFNGYLFLRRSFQESQTGAERPFRFSAAFNKLLEKRFHRLIKNWGDKLDQIVEKAELLGISEIIVGVPGLASDFNGGKIIVFYGVKNIHEICAQPSDFCAMVEVFF